MASTRGAILQRFVFVSRKALAPCCVGMLMRLSVCAAAMLITFAFGHDVLAEEPKSIALFDGKSLENWQAFDAGGSGEVTVKDGALTIGTGESITGVIYQKAKDLPLTNYEITLEAQRLEGNDFFVGLTFPVGDLKTCATLVMGGWAGSVTGISCIDELDASQNSTGHYRRFKDKTWYRVKLRVTPEELKVWCDDEEIINADIKGKKVGLRYGPIEDYAPLSFTTYQTTGAIRNIRLTPLVK